MNFMLDAQPSRTAKCITCGPAAVYPAPTRSSSIRTIGLGLGLAEAYGAYGYPYGYGYDSYAYDDGGCYLVRRRVMTPYGWRLRRVQVCN